MEGEMWVDIMHRRDGGMGRITKLQNLYYELYENLLFYINNTF